MNIDMHSLNGETSSFRRRIAVHYLEETNRVPEIPPLSIMSASALLPPNPTSTLP